MQPPPPRDPGDEIRRWLDGDGRWLTVVGPPGIGKSRLVQRIVAESEAAVTVLDPPPEPESVTAVEQRTIAVSCRRHRHPDEAVIEVGPLPGERAARLFVERARRLGITAALPDAAVGALVDRVEGHPQALDLLAGRLTVLTLDALLDRLDQPPEAGVDPLMHAARAPWDGLRRRLDVAWSALDPPARDTLRHCALFAGPFTADDVARIGGGDRLDALQTLRDHSLLTPGPALPAVIRRYVAACHGAPDPAARARHRRWVAQRAADLAGRAIEPDAIPAIAAFEPELRRAIDAIEAPPRDGSTGIPPDDMKGSDGIPLDRVAACDGARALAALYEHRGDPRAAETAALAARLAPGDDRARWVAGHICAARAARLAGDIDGSRAWLAATAADVEGPDPPVGPRLASRHASEQAAIEMLAGDLARAAELGESALALARRSRDPLLEARALVNLGGTRHWQNRLDDAVAAYAAARAISRRLGATRLVCISAANLCLVDIVRGHLPDARASGEEALTAFVALGDRRGEGTARNNLGMIALETDRLDEAAAHFEAAARCHDAVGFRQHAAYARLNLAEIALERGDRTRHDRLVERLTVLNHGHPGARVPIPGEGPLNDRALALHLHRSRARSALVRGEPDAAEAALERGRAASSGGGPAPERAEFEALAVRVALARGDVDAARAAWRRARDAAEGHTADRLAARVAVLGVAVGAWSGEDAAVILADALAAMPISLALRRTLRAVWPRLPRAARREARARGVPPPSLCLDPMTHEVRTPDGRWISLARRRLLWTLLGVLFEADGPLDPEAVIAAVWPGEQIQPDAASNRLYNAIALLRRAGLGVRLERVDAGYRLDPALRRARLDLDAP